MRRIIYSFILLVACVFVGQAQISNWQGVLRGTDDKPIADQSVQLRLLLHKAETLFTLRCIKLRRLSWV